jgi:hypothetical protein
MCIISKRYVDAEKQNTEVSMREESSLTMHSSLKTNVEKDRYRAVYVRS